MFDHPCLPSARILLNCFSQKPPYLWYFPLVIYYPLVLSYRTQLRGYKVALFLVVIQTEETTLFSMVKTLLQ